MGVGLQPLFDESWSIDNFELYTSDNLTYNWSPSGETTSSITVQPTTTTTYTVDVTSGSTTCQDSVTITVNPTHQITIDSSACDSIFWAGNWLASTGTFVDTLQNAVGCDSIVTLNLTIYNSTTGDTTATACDSLVWYGNTYTSTGTYAETLQTINGCDSVVMLNLTINNSTTGDTSATACDSLVWYGNTYTSTGAYSETLQTTTGCDSVVTLNLTIQPSPSLDLGDDTTLCHNTSVNLDAGAGYIYSWNNGNNTQVINASSTGNYVVTITNADGCSSVDSVYVTIATPLTVTMDSTNITCYG